LTAFACPNEDCSDFNRFGAGNLSVCEWMGKDQRIRRLYCSTCGQRFSERQGTLLQYSKLPERTVAQIVKCLVHGCSVEATADICEVTPRTVESLLDKAGRRAEDFHRLQLEKLTHPLEVVELDELHGRSAPAKKGALPSKLALSPRGTASDVVQAVRGFMRHWWRRPGS
jgi:transposase-like protein